MKKNRPGKWFIFHDLYSMFRYWFILSLITILAMGIFWLFSYHPWNPWTVYSIFCPPGWGEVIARNFWTGQIRNYTTGLPVTVPDGCFWAKQPQLHFKVGK